MSEGGADGTTASSVPAVQAGFALTPGLVVRCVVALLFVVLALSWARASIESHRYSAWGIASESAGDWESAVLNHRHALQWYAPAFTSSRDSFDALVRIGDDLARSGNRSGALVAYRSARWGVMAIRHVATPYTSELGPLHAKIGALMAAEVADGEAPDPTAAARYTAELDAWEERRPDPVLGLLASLGFMGWLGALGGLAACGFGPDGRVRGRAFAGWAVAVIVALISWLVCVRLA